MIDSLSREHPRKAGFAQSGAEIESEPLEEKIYASNGFSSTF
ncbi:hypothetical protein [Achromobacter animicus]|nr:hypothetical protein [Achromobacter animicus]